MWNWHSLTNCTQNNLPLSPAKLCQTTSRTAAVWNQLRCPSDSLQAVAVRGTVWLHMVWGWKCLPLNHHSTRRTIGFMHQLITRSDTLIPAVCYACRLWCPLPCHKWVTELIFVNLGVKVNGQYYCDVLLSQQMLPAIKRVTKEYVGCDEIGHFLCSVISQGKVVALDRWGSKWNHLSMTHRLTTNYAKNYCNRTLIVKVIVEDVATCFFGTQCI